MSTIHAATRHAMVACSQPLPYSNALPTWAPPTTTVYDHQPVVALSVAPESMHNFHVFQGNHNTAPAPLYVNNIYSHNQVHATTPRESSISPYFGSQGTIRKLYDLPEFNGRPEDWPIFITAFRESTAAYGYTPLENTFRLQKSIKGAARENVESLLISPQNVAYVLEQLEFKYGHPDVLIRSQLQNVHEISPIPENHLERLISFAAKVQNLTIFLKTANATQHLSNPTLLEQLTLKMPMSKRMEWASYSSTINPYPTLEHLSQWVKQLARIVATATGGVASIPVRPQSLQPKSNMKQVFAVNNSAPSTTPQAKDCVECMGSHQLSQCSQYLKYSPEKRWEVVKKHRMCFSCLSKGHNVYQCRRKKPCQTRDCKRLHHPTLHAAIKENNVQDKETHQVVTTQTKSFDEKTTKLLFKILPVELKGPTEKVVKAFAFIDEGSSATLVSDLVAKDLGLKGKNQSLTLQWIGGKQIQVPSMLVNLSIKGIGSGKVWHNLNATTVPTLDLSTQTVNLSELHSKYRHIKGLPLAEYSDATPQMLIGLNNCHLIRTLQTVQCSKDMVAAKTPLGWVIYGASNRTYASPPRVHFTIGKSQDNLESLVEDYFTTENFGVLATNKSLESKDDIRARLILEKSTKRVGARFETGLLWKSDDLLLPDSYSMAINRLHSIENKMRKDSKFAQQYKTAMMNNIEKGYARKLTVAEAIIQTPRTWYLPHFAVTNINKPGKVRLVFDAAAAVNGISLNSALLKGPDLNPPMSSILFKFREKAIGLCADIREMFLQVRIKKCDQDSQRFLWRDGDMEIPVQTYAMAAMIFGATCSPCSAQFVKNTNAKEVAADKPDVVAIITDQHYVDDLVCSFPNEETALRIGRAVKDVYLNAGFELRGFVSNSSCMQSQLNEEKSQLSTVVNMNNIDVVDKVLGMHWNSQNDQFIFRLQMNRVNPSIATGKHCPTKREFLSLVMSVYDPFGMLANILIYGKVLLQALWRTGIQWDEQIPAEMFAKFRQWIEKLRLVRDFRLDRCYSRYFGQPGVQVELHIFVDASAVAFAAVAYWRIVTSREVGVKFIAGKTRCAPLKLLSIPHLELQAAVLGTRLRSSILESHSVHPTRTMMWSDSKTVLSWIKSDHRQYKAFVAHRVGEILESTHENEWSWVPTDFNVADTATRTLYPIKYEPDNEWVNGPDFLRLPEDLWPKFTNNNEPVDSSEEKVQCRIIISEPPVIDMSKFFSFLRLVRTVAWIMRPLNRFRKRQQGHVSESLDELTVQEIYNAEIILCKLVQAEAFSAELKEVKANKILLKNSSIFALTPQLNEEGVLCVYGRVDYATSLPETTRHPIILPKLHIFTDMLVSWYHQRLHHQNDELVVNEIRQKYWVPHLRAAVKRAKSKCQQCKLKRTVPQPQIMGQLPADRLTPFVRPFTYTGIDYFGPMQVAIGRRREKRWGALFACMTTRAIHIELATDLSTDACILCIRNFVNRRGVPVKIRSDMGTNFVGADGELRKVKDIFDLSYIQRELSVKGIIWELNCPANPSSGGCWERLIQSTKKVLAIVLKAQAPHVETLRSLLIEAENIVNSRPLTHLPVDAADPDPLTPNHFLLGTTNSTQTPGDDTPFYSRKQYRISQQLKTVFGDAGYENTYQP